MRSSKTLVLTALSASKVTRTRTRREVTSAIPLWPRRLGWRILYGRRFLMPITVEKSRLIRLSVTIASPKRYVWSEGPVLSASLRMETRTSIPSTWSPVRDVTKRWHVFRRHRRIGHSIGVCVKLSRHHLQVRTLAAMSFTVFTAPLKPISYSMG